MIKDLVVEARPWQYTKNLNLFAGLVFARHLLDTRYLTRSVVAFVACDGGAVDPAELDALCLAHIARFKRPREYRFVAELPKNHYGKVLKTALCQRLQKEPPQ